MAPRGIPAPTQDVCQCGSMIMMTPYVGASRALVPVDPGRDPDGSLIIVGSSRGGYTVRLATDADADIPASQRRRAHWVVCPHPQRWDAVLSSIGLRSTVGTVDRSGPCAVCRTVHPWHYGGPIASPLCDPCRQNRGLPPMGEQSPVR
jgi:hypothetical protein